MNRIAKLLIYTLCLWQSQSSAGPLHDVIKENFKIDALGEVIRLLEGGENINGLSKFNETPLMLAARYGRIEIVRELINRGANLEAVGSRGRTALISAAEFCSEVTFKELLMRGANIEAKTRDGGTVIDMVGYSEDPDWIKEGRAAVNEVIRQWSIKKQIKWPETVIRKFMPYRPYNPSQPNT
ncbi:MAG: ankyrin repeat domain-containing protein, partial [Minisyncoccia bacterium]